MRITNVSIFSPKNPKSNYKLHKTSNPLCFQANITKSDILKAGYAPVSIQNLGLQSKSDKIIIDSSDKFIALANSPNMWNKKIILSNDIDLNGAEIKPIGDTEMPFSGEFDGNGCKISNFKIVSDNDSYNVGLFGKCQDAKFSNIDISQAFISGGQRIGGIAGWAKNCKFDNCFFQGYIKGEKNIGGLIGMSRNNEIKNSATVCNIESISNDEYNPFDFSDNVNSTGVAGGLIGSDELSEINGSYSEAKIKGNEQIGGLIGYAKKTNINNSTFNGSIICDKNAGSIIGWAEDTFVSSSYSLANKKSFFGLDINNTTNRVYNDLAELMFDVYDWNYNLWYKAEDKVPRLKIREKRMSAKELFLEDVNNDIATNKIEKKVRNSNPNMILCQFDLNPPKHFESNDTMLEKIRTSKDRDWLFEEFGQIVLKINCEKEYREYNGASDELLLELVKNPYMDLNSRYDNSYNIHCTPLFILTCLNEAYVLQEALKRDDVDVTVGSGYSKKMTPLKQALIHHIDACSYVFLNEPKMAKYIKPMLNDFKTMDITPFVQALLETYPNLPKYYNYKGGVEFNIEFDVPKELVAPLQKVSSLEDVQKSTDIDSWYSDSRGNNIANVAVNLSDDEDFEALSTIVIADEIGTDLSHTNNKMECPFGHAIYRNKPHIVGYLLDKVNPYLRIGDGTDAMLLFSNNPDEDLSLNYMEKARERGLSVNSQANDGSTPLINAVNLKHYNKIKYLLSHGANPNLCDAFHQTALHKACMNNDEKAIDLLLDSYAYPDFVDEPGLKPFEYLDDELQKKFKEKFDNLSYFYKLAQFEDVTKPDNQICNVDNYSEVRSDAVFNSTQYRLLDIDFNQTILHLCKNTLLNPYLKSKKDLDGNNILNLVAGIKSPYAKECIKIALEKGYDVNNQNKYGETPLIKALDAYLGAVTTEEKIILMQNIKALLDANPDVDLVDNNKQGALHRVCESGNPLLLMEILKLNPKVNQVDSLGQTPFDYIPKDIENAIRQIINKYMEKII